MPVKSIPTHSAWMNEQTHWASSLVVWCASSWTNHAFNPPLEACLKSGYRLRGSYQWALGVSVRNLASLPGKSLCLADDEGESLGQMQRGQCYRGRGMGASSAEGEEPTFSAEKSPWESAGSGRILSHLHPRAESSSLSTSALTITADPLGSWSLNFLIQPILQWVLWLDLLQPELHGCQREDSLPGHT